MCRKNRMLVATVAFSVLASPLGGRASEGELFPPGVPEISPRLNGDGNYNIISILTDQEHHTFDRSARGFVRGLVTERYKFTRYFSTDFNTSTTLEELLEKNDIELYDLQNDPQELVNLAANPENREELILELNALLNQLIAEEIGVDDGGEVTAALQDYEARLHPESRSGCSLGGAAPWGLSLILPGMLLLLYRGKRRK